MEKLEVLCKIMSGAAARTGKLDIKTEKEIHSR